MDYRVSWTEVSLADLEGVHKYICRDSPYYAAVFVREVREASRSLSRFPLRGRIVPETNDSTVRELMVRNYRLIYKVMESDVYILAFVHGARDLSELWKRDWRDTP